MEERVAELMKPFEDNRKGTLIPILQRIQAEYGYLPQEALQIVSNQTPHSMVDIYGVATFYKSFRLKPRGKAPYFSMFRHSLSCAWCTHDC